TTPLTRGRLACRLISSHGGWAGRHPHRPRELPVASRGLSFFVLCLPPGGPAAAGARRGPSDLRGRNRMRRVGACRPDRVSNEKSPPDQGTVLNLDREATSAGCCCARDRETTGSPPRRVAFALRLPAAARTRWR